MPKKFLLVLLIFGFALLFAWSRIHVVELGYDVSKLKSEVEGLKRENGVLKSQWARAQSIDVLVRLADKWGMHPPTNDRVFFIEGE